MTSLSALTEEPVRRSISHDAVVIIPGIMGSELVDRRNGDVLWTMGSILRYSVHRRGHEAMSGLEVTEDERSGKTGRVAATRLLSAPSWSPKFGGIEPYGKLVHSLRPVLADPAAVLEFPYDWRLSVTHNARVLAEAMADHLARWRAHPGHAVARRRHPDEREARLVLVAHSMGGLLVQALSAISGAVDDVRATVTLGTPFHGSVKAVELLAHGTGAPPVLPVKSVRHMVGTLPGLYDLLPSYRARLLGDDVVALSPADVVSLGGDGELAREAFEARRRLAGVRLPGHTLVAGVGQQTMQSFEVRDGVVHPQPFGYRRHADDSLMRDEIGRLQREDHSGDGTVFRYAAALDGVPVTTIGQQHQALARTRSALDIVAGVIVGTENLGTVLGPRPIGIDLPEAVIAGHPFRVTVTGDDDPARISCVVEDAVLNDRIIARAHKVRRTDDGALAYEVTLRTPGLYRVRVSGRGDPVTKLVLVDPNDDDRD